MLFSKQTQRNEDSYIFAFHFLSEKKKILFISHSEQLQLPLIPKGFVEKSDLDVSSVYSYHYSVDARLAA